MLDNDTEDRVYKFYNEIVEPMYAELLQQGIRLHSVTEKNNQVLSAIASANRRSNVQDAQSDLDTAFRFVVDAGLEVAQEIALKLSTQANEILSNKEKTKWCACAPKEKVIEDHKYALKTHKEALESRTNTPNEREEAVYKFKEAATAYRAWIGLFDPELLQDFKYFQWKNAARSQTIGFIVGLITSTIVTVAAWQFLPPQQASQSPPQVSKK
ncbi:hypothetical protein SAMN05216404_11518 [Nitrosospira multiformis]|uniref:Uncharacterized protein n=1 Tax=Nitrosospira multiformis TaxID=1231 RepID=A0A1H8N4D1_9PROT|nr:hypothetical protein [Nitrosospira multiformis]SEO24422.1 hypothetical protein SAMN05216404_11518 [Nitrosospira multiformis]